MSYILDALKKAESERKLGSVPNVYREALPIAKSDEPVSLLRRPWVWIAVGLLVMAGIVWIWMQAPQHEAQQASLPAAPMIVAQAAEQTAPVPEEARETFTPSVVTRSSTPALTKGEDVRSKKREATADAVKPAAPVKAPLAATRTQATKKSDPIKESIRDKEAAQDLHPKKSVARAEPEKNDKAQSAPSGASSSQHADTQIATLRDLPESIQRSIPPISIGGYIYSPNPAGRSMLLNNRLVREGEQAASGVILEKMMPKEAVMNYQGQRFRLPY